MIVVADTSPLNYLILIEHDNILPKLYARVVIPPEVLQELSHPQAPDAVRSWVKNPPAWLEVKAPGGPPDEALAFLILESARRYNWPKNSTLTCS